MNEFEIHRREGATLSKTRVKLDLQNPEQPQVVLNLQKTVAEDILNALGLGLRGKIEVES